MRIALRSVNGYQRGSLGSSKMCVQIFYAVIPKRPIAGDAFSVGARRWDMILCNASGATRFEDPVEV
jgi:hypothetical protein